MDLSLKQSRGQKSKHVKSSPSPLYPSETGRYSIHLRKGIWSIHPFIRPTPLPRVRVYAYADYGQRVRDVMSYTVSRLMSSHFRLAASQRVLDGFPDVLAFNKQDRLSTAKLNQNQSKRVLPILTNHDSRTNRCPSR